MPFCAIVMSAHIDLCSAAGVPNQNVFRIRVTPLLRRDGDL